MQIEISRTFSSSPGEVHRALVDPCTQTAKADAVGALDHSFDSRELDGGRLEVVTRRKVATAGMPEFVRSLVNASMTVVETEVWRAADPDGSRHASFHLDIEGAPVLLRGSAHLLAVEGGTTLAWCGTLEATVPFFRSKITESASASIYETIEHEFDLIEKSLTPVAADGSAS